MPRELAFKLSPSKITSSPAVFKVTNKGKLPHSFKVCTKPTQTDKANSCAGVTTKLLAPGATAMLSVKLTASGKYEYLSGNARQAASGMKGIVTVLLPSATTPTTGAGGGTTATPVDHDDYQARVGYRIQRRGRQRCCNGCFLPRRYDRAGGPRRR